MTPLARAAERVLERAMKAFKAEAEIEQEALADAVAAKRPLANHYWQGRHRAEQRLRAALAVWVAINEED